MSRFNNYLSHIRGIFEGTSTQQDRRQRMALDR